MKNPHQKHIVDISFITAYGECVCVLLLLLLFLYCLLADVRAIMCALPWQAAPNKK